MDLPLGLTSALESGNCVLFLGAGIGYHLRRPSGERAPTGADLAKAMAESFRLGDVGDEPDLAQIAQIVELRRGRPELMAYLETSLKNLEPDEDLQWLISRTWRAIYTTNYDAGIERCYDVVPDARQSPVIVATNSAAQSWDPRFEVPVFHLHGSLFSAGGRDAILITENDYATFREKRRMLFDYFRLSWATTPILYVGYSHRDPNWRMITQEVRAEFAPSKPPISYRLVPDTPPLEREILVAQGVETLDGAIPDLRAAVTATLGDLRVEPSQLDAVKSHVPVDLHPAFDASPASVSRLLNCWDYVNQADFGIQPNTSAFHRGDRPNWALVGNGINFQRDLEQPLVDRLVDFATDPKPKVHVEIALGPAGYGMTTLLMAVAAWFARNRVGTTLYLKQGAQLRPADIEFAVNHLKAPIVFFVDSAADYAEELGQVVHLLRELSVPAFLLLGERLNEWRQRRPSIRPREHALEPLSDDEIWRLLGSLEVVGALGRLADVSEQLRFSAIKLRNQQELLVTMRELTEGRAFDAIIEDEYRAIATDSARDLYGVVATFSRVRALPRDTVCADALGIPLNDLYGDNVDGLEGIVMFEPFDEARGLYFARTRHHIIADIVWQRCLDRLQREHFLSSALNALNLSFGVDSKAFEQFTRDDQAVDSLQSLEAKTRFFESACRKDPSNPYVRQHYARMLRREERYELALGQIDQALAMKPGSRILLHTRGVILRDLAVESSVLDVGRRRLAQSEAAFESALKVNPRDEYAYQSLAELYLDWAKRVQSQDESVEYVTKAENAIQRGMQMVRQREGLYIVSSKIEDFLGDTPARINALRKALDESPTSSIACYLLGTVLRKQKKYKESKEVLHAGLLSHPDDPRLAVSFALTVHESGLSYSEALGVLSLARNAGRDDPVFAAVYGGMLVMSGDLSAAQPIWNRSTDGAFSIQDMKRIGFEPKISGDPIWVEGVVKRTGPGYSFIAASGISDFFCPASASSGVPLIVGKTVQLRIGFSVRGPVAIEVREAV